MEPKSRHWVLTVWLVYSIVDCIVSNVSVWVQVIPGPNWGPRWWNTYIAWYCLAMLVFYAAIWKWKRWGFYGVGFVILVNATLNAVFYQKYFGLMYWPVSVFILFMALQVGGEKNGWKQLE